MKNQQLADEFHKRFGTKKIKSYRQAVHCIWCGRKPKRSRTTREHLIPISKGGSNRLRNVTMSCVECNHRRGNNTDWQAYKSVPFGDLPTTQRVWLTVIHRKYSQRVSV